MSIEARTIEIVYSSTPRFCSLLRSSAEAIAAALATRYSDVRLTRVNTISDLDDITDRHPDLVFLGMKYVYDNQGDEYWISSHLDKLGIAYTGSDQLAHSLEANKQLAKQRVIEHGLATSPYLVTNGTTIGDTSNMTYPLFVKPSNRGGGKGVDRDSVVHTPQQLTDKVELLIARYGGNALIEEYLSGREFSVSIVGTSDNQLLALPIELVAEPNDRGVRILSSSVKSSNTEVVSRVTDLSLKQRIDSLALAIFAALGARDYGRIDMRLDAAGNPQFLEANLIPSLAEGYGSFPKACDMYGHLSYSAMIISIAQMGLRRTIPLA